MEKEEKENKAQRAPEWSWYVLIVFCLLLLLFGGIRSCKKSQKEKNEGNNKTESNSPKYHYMYKTINFSGEYGEVIYLPSGSMAAFLDATEPYCSINRDNHEECGERGQDISTKMGDTDANTELRFKSSNGKHGTLRIRVRDK